MTSWSVTSLRACTHVSISCRSRSSIRPECICTRSGSLARCESRCVADRLSTTRDVPADISVAARAMRAVRVAATTAPRARSALRSRISMTAASLESVLGLAGSFPDEGFPGEGTVLDANRLTVGIENRLTVETRQGVSRAAGSHPAAPPWQGCPAHAPLPTRRGGRGCVDADEDRGAVRPRADESRNSDSGGLVRRRAGASEPERSGRAGRRGHDGHLRRRPPRASGGPGTRRRALP